MLHGRNIIATIILTLGWTFTFIIPLLFGYGDGLIIGAFFYPCAIFATYLVVQWVNNDPESSRRARQRRLNSLLDQMEGDELQTLRQRLSYRDEREYESLEALLDDHQEKRKVR